MPGKEEEIYGSFGTTKVSSKNDKTKEKCPEKNPLGIQTNINTKMNNKTGHTQQQKMGRQRKGRCFCRGRRREFTVCTVPSSLSGTTKVSSKNDTTKEKCSVKNPLGIRTNINAKMKNKTGPGNQKSEGNGRQRWLNTP